MWRVFWLLDPYVPKTYHVLRIRHPWDGIRWGVCNTSLPCYPKMWSVFKINHVPGQLPRPRQRPWFSFAFFSFIKERKEGRGMGVKPPIFIPQDQYIQKTWRVFRLLDRYIRKMNHVSIIHQIWTSKTWRVFGLLDRYNPKNVPCFAHSPSLGWRPVGRMQYAPTWDLKKSTRFLVTR